MELNAINLTLSETYNGVELFNKISRKASLSGFTVDSVALQGVTGVKVWCSKLTRTAGVSVEVLQEGQERVRGDTVDGHHSAPGLRVLPAEHGRHDVAACYQHCPVSWQHTPWMAGTRISRSKFRE